MILQLTTLFTCLLMSSFLWFSSALAKSAVDITLTVDGHVFEERLTFSREDYFVSVFTFDFERNGVNLNSPLSVKGKNVPAGFLSARPSLDRTGIKVELSYPDPVFGSIDLEEIGQFQLKLYIENEDDLVIRRILKTLGKKHRVNLLLDTGRNLDSKNFKRVEDPFLAALIKSGLGASRSTVINALDLLPFAHTEKVNIARMVLGFSDASEIIKMRERMDNHEALKAFAKEISIQIGKNDVLEYLLEG